MRRNSCRAAVVVLLLFLVTVPGTPAEPISPAPATESAPASPLPGGQLRIAPGSDGQGETQAFPLKHTEVRAEITGNVAQVRVSQIFQNPYSRAIEAIYVFPLPRTAAVDDMEIRLGDRVIRGVIKRREEARAIYDAARRSGRTAALLDQERPNIFTQSVANILPGEEVAVSLRFFQVLPYDSGGYEFTFPMVVGPRFIPGEAVRQQERGWAPDTTDVPDASRITPPVLVPGDRSGHDISLEVAIRAGSLLHDLASPSHAVEVMEQAPGSALVRLRQEDSIPNRDFVLRYRLDGAAPEIVLLPHRTEGPGYFLMLIQPEVQPSRDRVTPKEMIFVVDCSGSMWGPPIEKVKEAMHYALENLNPLDNFQIIRFSEKAEAFAPEAVPATPSHVARALEYVNGLSGEGGTIMLSGVEAALSAPEDPQRLRIVSFMTDGYIGNEDQILAYLREHLGGARLFSFGVGSSPNRYLLDKMAEFGRGAVQYLPLTGQAADSVRPFYDKIRNPYLTDMEMDWGDLHVSEVFPARIPDLFLGQPVVLFGRYDQPGAGEATLRGRLGGEPYERRLRIDLPERGEEGEAIASLWARSKIEELSHRPPEERPADIVEQITNVALAHRLVSATTSFVAVEDQPRTAPEEPAQVQVPVPMPEGVSYENVFGPPARQELYETVRVEAQAGVVNTGSAQLSTVITSEFISGMPVLGKDYQDVLTLAPGVTDVNNTGNPNIHGARDTGVVTLVDGVSVTIPRGDTWPTFCRLMAARKSYRVGERIVLQIAIKNLSQRTLRLPAALSVADGTALFRILDEGWSATPNPVSARRAEKKRALLPGDWIVFKVTLNAEGGYRLDRPGLYRLVFLGSELDLPDSTQLTIRIEP